MGRSRARLRRVRGLRVAVLGLLVALLGLPTLAIAHDDPIVTVRVLCNGFNVLDMDAVLGEISDAATLSVDRPVKGATEIRAWVKDQMDHDLRIEIVDMGSPQRLSDGYTLSWTARFSREDWRQEGIAARDVTNAITIHNGRITDWNATLAPLAGTAAPAPAVSPAVAAPSAAASGVPELLGVPVTLVLAISVLALAGLWMTRRLLVR